MAAASPQAEAPETKPPRTVLLTRSAAQGAAFARALGEECTQNGVGECRVLFAPLQQARTGRDTSGSDSTAGSGFSNSLSRTSRASAP